MADGMDWMKVGVNYYENPDCPREYLEEALIDLLADFEDVTGEEKYVKGLSDAELRKQVKRYEYFADK